MKEEKKVAVIYAAGKGSRFEGLDDNQSKCSLPIYIDKNKKSYITTLTGTINAYLSNGISEFYIVIGHAKESVIADCDRLKRIYGKAIKITYVENSKWDYHGCEYSVNLGLKRAIDGGATEIFLNEGDSLIAPEFISRLVDVPKEYNAVLVRSISMINPSRSVIAESHIGGPVTSFWYDQSHKATSIEEVIPNDILYLVTDFYESGQVWKLKVTDALRDDVDSYISRCETLTTPDTHSGLVTLNLVADRDTFIPVFARDTDGLYNMNTKEDYDSIQKMILSAGNLL